MAPYQDRVIEENKELLKKIDALNTYMHSIGFSGLSGEVREGMFRQLEAMREYSDSLEERIKLF